MCVENMPAIKSIIQEAWKVNQKLEQFAVAPFCPHGNVKRKKDLFWLLILFTHVTVKSNILNFEKVIMHENLKQNIKSFSSF